MDRGTLVTVAALASVALPACTCSSTRPSPPSETLVGAEVADDAALAILADWRGMPVFGTGRYAQQSSDDRGTAGKNAVALWDHGNRDMNNFVCAGDQRETPTSRVPFVFDLPACPEPWVRGLVMARFEGSGRLARFWMTAASIRSRPADRELVRFYVDDDTTPRIQARLGDMLVGTGSELLAPPFGAGSARRVAFYYPVVFGKRLVVTLDRTGDNDLYFHQTAVVLEPAPGERRAAPAASPLRETARRLLQAEAPASGTARPVHVALRPSETTTTHELVGPATIVAARVATSRTRMRALGDVRLSVRWDEATPQTDHRPAAPAAIDLPLADLFAAGEAIPEGSSLALGGVSTGEAVELALRLPMPFSSRARWELANGGSEPVELDLTLEVADGVPSARFGHLVVQRHETTNARGGPHPLASATGPGRLVGVCVTLLGHGLGRGSQPMHFLEGDELGIVDGRRAIVGTGTEDYFNGAFYFEGGSYATPFAQAWGIVPEIEGRPPRAQVNACRWHVLGDAIDFAESLDLALEIGPGVADLLDRYRSVAFLYR